MRQVWLAPKRFADRRRPVLFILVALGVAVECAFEVAESDDEASPTVDKATLENVVFEERPRPVPESAGHRDALAGELCGTKRGVAVGLPDDLGQVAKRELPDRILQRADRLGAPIFITLVHRLKRVAHAAFAKELWLAEVRVPSGTLDPPAHHEAAPRHAIDVKRRTDGEQAKYLIADRGGAAFVGV